jgi:hypothetical protein
MSSWRFDDPRTCHRSAEPSDAHDSVLNSLEQDAPA